MLHHMADSEYGSLFTKEESLNDDDDDIEDVETIYDMVMFDKTVSDPRCCLISL